MTTVDKNDKLVCFAYDNSDERNAHINEYGRTHILKRVCGKGTETDPLIAVFEVATYA